MTVELAPTPNTPEYTERETQVIVLASKLRIGFMDAAEDEIILTNLVRRINPKTHKLHDCGHETDSYSKWTDLLRSLELDKNDKALITKSLRAPVRSGIKTIGQIRILTQQDLSSRISNVAELHSLFLSELFCAPEAN